MFRRVTSMDAHQAELQRSDSDDSVDIGTRKKTAAAGKRPVSAESTTSGASLASSERAAIERHALAVFR